MWSIVSRCFDHARRILALALSIIMEILQEYHKLFLIFQEDIENGFVLVWVSDKHLTPRLSISLGLLMYSI